MYPTGACHRFWSDSEPPSKRESVDFEIKRYRDSSRRFWAKDILYPSADLRLLPVRWSA